MSGHAGLPGSSDEKSQLHKGRLQNKSIDNLFIVSEPEAAAVHMLSTSAEIKSGDCFVLLDAGGGTVDANTYRVSREEPLRLETEIVAPGGGLHGSSYLNEGFREYLNDLLAGETYLNDGIETIHGIVERITFEEFEKRIKRGYDYNQQTARKEIYIKGLRDNPAKGFRNECIYVPRLKIREIFFRHLDAIAEIVKSQLDEARGKGYTVGKVVLIGGFGTSISLSQRLQEFLLEYGREYNCRVTLMEPQQGTSIINAVASGAVLRALNKANGPERVARSSYGILRTEPFGQYPEHAGLKPSYDRHDGMPYIKQTIDWVLKLGESVPSVWQCEPFACSHTFDVWPVRPFICREMLYVSDHVTKSHYRKTHPNNEGAEYVGEIEVDFSSLRDRLVPIEPIVNKNQQKVGKRHYRIDFTMAIKVVDRDLESLIREEKYAKELQSVYPNLTPIIGDLSSLSLLTSTAAEADFVIHAGGDDVPAVCAMIDGLSSRVTNGSPMPRLISLTGPRSLIDFSSPITGNLNESSSPWSDISDGHAILNVPKDRIHAGADQAIIAHSADKGVGTMLISPGQLWGRGKGHLKKESNSAFYYAAVKSRGRAFVIGEGTATWSWVSISDLGDAVVFLMDQALSKRQGQVGINQDGYYFVSTGDLSMVERAKAVSERLGLGEVESVSVDTAREIHPFGPIMWGCGERIRSDKLVELGWRPKQTEWKALMEEEGGGRA